MAVEWWFFDLPHGRLKIPFPFLGVTNRRHVPGGAFGLAAAFERRRLGCEGLPVSGGWGEGGRAVWELGPSDYLQYYLIQ